MLIPLFAWVVAQSIKALILTIRERQFNLSYLVSMGGMPSAHTALVCSLATTVGLVDGVNSTLFAFTVIFAAVVMYDAAGLRQEISAQSVILNQMVKELFTGRPAFEKHLRELIGHTKVEVIVGAALGILLAWLLT